MPHRIARSGIARTYQIPRPFRSPEACWENVALPPMFGQVVMDRAPADRDAGAGSSSPVCRRGPRLPPALNLHQRKFLELARALASRPKLLLLDEVLSGLTPGEIDAAVTLVRPIRDQGATVVFVEHKMRAVLELTDRLVVFNFGATIARARLREVMRQPDVVERLSREPPCLKLRQRHSVAYGDAPALCGVDDALAEGELVAIVGP